MAQDVNPYWEAYQRQSQLPEIFLLLYCRFRAS